METKTRQCAHLDQELRWFGFREERGQRLHLFRCLTCGKIIASRMPLTIKGTSSPKPGLTGLSHI